MNSQITYEPIIDDFPSVHTLEDLRKLYNKLRPLFGEEERKERVIQIREE